MDACRLGRALYRNMDADGYNLRQYSTGVENEADILLEDQDEQKNYIAFIEEHTSTVIIIIKTPLKHSLF